jgi:hypothetical protein
MIFVRLTGKRDTKSHFTLTVGVIFLSSVRFLEISIQWIKSDRMVDESSADFPKKVTDFEAAFLCATI